MAFLARYFNGSKYRPVPGKIPGTPVTLRGLDFVLAPLCLDDFIALEDELKRFGTEQNSAQMMTAAKAAYRSMLANHPDITFPDVRRLIDVSNIGAVMRAITSVNGLDAAPPGETQPAGKP